MQKSVPVMEEQPEDKGKLEGVGGVRENRGVWIWGLGLEQCFARQVGLNGQKEGQGKEKEQ